MPSSSGQYGTASAPARPAIHCVAASGGASRTVRTRRSRIEHLGGLRDDFPAGRGPSTGQPSSGCRFFAAVGTQYRRPLARSLLDAI